MTTEELGYNITSDPNYLYERNGTPLEIAERFPQIHQLALEGKRSNIKVIQELIEEYPSVPQLKNYLSVLYRELNDKQKVYDVNKWILAEHPDYLFGILNLAAEHYIEGEFEKMPDAMGHDMMLKSLYPDRDTFHIMEVVAFFKIAILYYTAIGNLDQAEIRYQIMLELAPYAPETQVAQEAIDSLKANNFKRNQAEGEQDILVNNEVNEGLPQFNHQEIEWLYSFDFRIDEEKLHTILSLPRETLIQDLEAVINDSIERYSYYKQVADASGWDEEKFSFLIHAFFLLGELKATSSLDSIFTLLSQSEDCLTFYLGDILTELVWEVVYKVANNNLEACKQFVFRPDVYTYARSAVANMVVQIAFHQPARRNEVISWFKDVLQFHLNRNEDEIDSDYMAFLVSDIIEIEAKELMPEVKRLYDGDMVSEWLCGDWQEVSQDLNKPNEYSHKQDILTIFERYNKVTTTWAGYIDEEVNLPSPLDLSKQWIFDELNEHIADIKPVRAEPKIGRNEKCPCGSGKKYKKCCLNK